eukprot:gnl/MRDRNA2_/MRDRNA2_92900_c0_seq1.p1 gnl/MRDRNA2_/MRDRNA2_92900_c0~~gnl/MRDRNA2_/MRDRNA2_92900_c0_seq1.p1  ORF type:complete len:1387 (+),score=271.12 gnl/MRDRNA2_/MRDRNA2_92900_c0_seq1:56-4216(+)
MRRSQAIEDAGGTAISWLADQDDFFEHGDDTFELRQLLLATTDVLDEAVHSSGSGARQTVFADSVVDHFDVGNASNVAMQRLSVRPAKPKRDVAAILLKCIRKALSKMRKAAIQRQLQDFVLEFCLPRTSAAAVGTTRSWQAAFERWVSVDDCRLDNSTKLRPGNFVQPDVETLKVTPDTATSGSSRVLMRATTNVEAASTTIQQMSKKAVRHSAMAMSRERVSLKRMSISGMGSDFLSDKVEPGAQSGPAKNVVSSGLAVWKAAKKLKAGKAHDSTKNAEYLKPWLRHGLENRCDATGRILKPGMEFARKDPKCPVATSEKCNQQWHLVNYFQRCVNAEVSPLEVADPFEAMEFLAPDESDMAFEVFQEDASSVQVDRPQSAPLGRINSCSRRIFMKDESAENESEDSEEPEPERHRSRIYSMNSDLCDQSCPTAVPDDVEDWLGDNQSPCFSNADPSSPKHQEHTPSDADSPQRKAKNAARPTALPRELPRADTKWWHNINALKNLKPCLANPSVPTGRILSQACAKEGVLLRKPDFVFHELNGCLDVRGRQLSDAELRAIAVAISKRSKPPECPNGVHTLLLDENCFGAEGALALLDQIGLEGVRILSMARCPYVNSAIARVSTVLGRKGQRLRTLDLSGNPLSSGAFRALSTALISLSQLEILSLSDTTLGASMQEDCVVLCESFAECQNLKELRLGGNHLHSKGCTALGEAIASLVYLQELDLAGNAGRVGSGPEPIDFFCETLSLNDTLSSLDLSYCQLGYGAAFILEEALATHPKLQRFSCRGNPLGTPGFECFVRYMMNPNAKVNWCDFGEFRDHPVAREVHVYQALNPSGYYTLDLEQPLDRAILCRCLKWMHSAKLDIGAGELAFQNLTYDGQAVKNGELGKLIHLDTMHGVLPRWIVPQEGIMRAYFNAEFTLMGKSVNDVVQYWEKQRKTKVTLSRFVLLAALWRRLLVFEQHRIFIKAIAGTCLINMAQLRFFLEGMDPDTTLFIVENLYPCVDASERTAILDVVKRPEIADRSRKRARSLFFFNPENPTGRYAFDLLLPVDHSTAERVLTINLWLKFQAYVMNRPDVSQHGDHECIRNACLDRDPFAYNSHWVLPPPGTKTVFAFDFSSPIRPSSKSLPMLPQTWGTFVETLETAECRDSTKLLALRCVADQLVLRPQQLLELVRTFEGEQGDGAGDGHWAKYGKTVEHVSLSQKPQLQHLSARVEALVTCFNRTADRQTVCSPQVLYAPGLFSNAMRKSIRDRLGHLVVFDVINCCQLVKSNLGTNHYLNLSVFEDNRFMHMMVILGAKEEGENLIETFWSEAAAYTEGRFFFIPATWIQAVPQIGNMTFKYVSEKPEYAMYNLRSQLGRDYLSWSNIEVPRDLKKTAYQY